MQETGSTTEHGDINYGTIIPNGKAGYAKWKFGFPDKDPEDRRTVLIISYVSDGDIGMGNVSDKFKASALCIT